MSDERSIHLPTAAATVAIAAAMALTLWLMGRTLWCSCASPAPWSGDIWSKHNSQHLADPYLFTHVLHGLALYGLAWLVERASRRELPRVRWLIALAIESAWEVAENTPMVIEKYREATISLDYFGDSVANSLGDLAAMGLGYVIARRLPIPATLGLFVLTELVLLWWIRDSLLVNVLMLLWPLEAVKQWQLGV